MNYNLMIHCCRKWQSVMDIPRFMGRCSALVSPRFQADGSQFTTVPSALVETTRAYVASPETDDGVQGTRDEGRVAWV